MSAPGDAAAIARRLGMERLPVEGTLWRQTWIGPAGPGGAPAGTAMLGLYAADPPSRSLFHRLASDEVWHFHAGDPLRLVLLHPDGSDEEVVLGGDPRAGARFQHVVPAGTWQAGELVPGGAWALFGCTMAPGFTAEQFEGGAVSTLLAAYPARAADVQGLGVPDGRPTGLESG